MRKARDWTRTIHTEVEIDLDEELSDDDLLALARERGLELPQALATPDDPQSMPPREWWRRLTDEIRNAARSGDRMHIDVLLHRVLVTLFPPPLPTMSPPMPKGARQ